jgi:hypothetical protein
VPSREVSLGKEQVPSRIATIGLVLAKWLTTAGCWSHEALAALAALAALVVPADTQLSPQPVKVPVAGPVRCVRSVLSSCPGIDAGARTVSFISAHRTSPSGTVALSLVAHVMTASAKTLAFVCVAAYQRKQ